MTPLHLAIANDQHAAVRLLVHSGADVSLADNRGLTPLRLAVEMGDKATVELVLAADPPAEVDIEDKVRQNKNVKTIAGWHVYMLVV